MAGFCSRHQYDDPNCELCHPEMDGPMEYITLDLVYPNKLGLKRDELIKLLKTDQFRQVLVDILVGEIQQGNRLLINAIKNSL